MADCLRQYPPFDDISLPDVMDLAGSGRVKFHSSEEFICQQGDARTDLVWFIQQGRVELLTSEDNEETLHDVAGAGDIIGLDALIGEGRAHFAARTLTDVIVYGLSTALLSRLAQQYPHLDRYIKARFSLEGWADQSRTSWLDAPLPPIAVQASRRTATIEADPATTGQAIAMMIEHDCRALLTPAGTLTASDLELFSGSTVLALLDQLRTAPSAAFAQALLPLVATQLRAAFAGPSHLDQSSVLADALLRALLTSAIRHADASSGLTRPATPHCWVLFGAAARADLPELESPTIAVLYDEAHPAASPTDSLWFVSTVALVSEWLTAAGLAKCEVCWPTGAQPAMPLSEWQRLFSETIANPLASNLYERREFFDIAYLAGDPSLFEALEASIRAALAQSSMAIALLANDTMSHIPPLTFFDGLVVQMDGARTESFNIDQSILSPIADAARVYAMSEGNCTPAGTLSRLRDSEAAEAYRIALYFRALLGTSNIRPTQLERPDQLLLKSAISSVSRFVSETASRFVEVD